MLNRLFYMSCLLAYGLRASYPAWANDEWLSDPNNATMTQPQATQTVQHRVTLKEGTPILVMLETPITSDKNRMGDPVEATLVQDVYLYNSKLLPRQTRFYGQIDSLDIPLAGRNPLMGITFNRLQLTDGCVLPLHAYVKTARADHRWGGELTPGTKPKLVLHSVAGIGDYKQVILGGPRQRGAALQFGPGTMWTLILTAPLALPNVTHWEVPANAWP